MRRALAWAALAALCAASGAAAQGALAKQSARQLPAGLHADDALLADIDRDGKVDLLVGAHDSERRYARSVLLWSAIADGGPNAPVRLDLTPDVVAWAVGDVHADRGAEVVLFSASSAFAWRAKAPEGERFVRLLACDFLWQIPGREQAWLIANSVIDFEGDGLDDLLIPEPGGWRLALQRRAAADAPAEFVEQRRLGLPPEASDWEGLGPETAGSAAVRGGSRGSTMSFAVDLSGETEAAGAPATLFAMVESAPAPKLVDWDGDGRLDLAAQSVERLHVWRQGDGGALASAPSGSFALPVVADRVRRLDASYSSEALDLDGDQRADIVILAGDSRSEDVRTQLMCFQSKAAPRGAGARDPFGERGVPQDLLVLAGFVASAEFVDLDGDRLPELVARTVRPDLIDQLRSAASETIDAELFVYRNSGGKLARRPSLSWRYTVPIKAFLPTVSFVGDLSGDRLSDLLVRDQPSRLRLFLMRAQGEAWSLVADRPLWEATCDPDAEVRLLSAPGRPVSELVLLEPTRVVHVRFGR